MGDYCRLAKRAWHQNPYCYGPAVCTGILREKWNVRRCNVIKLAAKEEAAEDHRILKEIQKELIRKKRQQKQTEATPSEKGYRRGQRAEA